MHSTRLKTHGIALAIVGAAFVLTLAAPRTVIAQSHGQTAETSHAASGLCDEQHRVELVAQPLGASLALADQHVPAPYTAHTLQPEENVLVELQVPTALLRTLETEEENNRIIELHVPAALLATLSAEGRVQMPQRSPDLCTPFCSLY